MKKLAILSLVLVSNLFAVDNTVDKSIVSVYELKATIADLINRFYDLEERVNALQSTALKNSAELAKLEAELSRIKKVLEIVAKTLPRVAFVSVQEASLYTPNGKELDKLPYGTKVLVLFRDGNLCYIPGGVVKCSDLSFGGLGGLNYGYKIQSNR